MTVNGNLQATGSITATGACCTSDPLVKRNITNVDTIDMLNLANRMELINFRWSEEYEKLDKRIDKTIKYVGFNARQMRKVFPQATQIVEKKVGGELYKDFHLLHKDELLPVAIGAIQQLTIQYDQLSNKFDRLSNNCDRLLKEYDYLWKKIHNNKIIID